MSQHSSPQSIARWPEGERPRERLLAEGADVLSDAHLLAIVLRVGRQSKSAVDVGREVLEQVNGVQELANRSVQELCVIPGIGPAKAAQIKAAIELGKRALKVPLEPKRAITTSRMVYEHFAPEMRDMKKEECRVILLDAKHAMIRWDTVSQGTLTSSLVHPREVFNGAVRASAAAVIFVHNHPSGDPTPSREDRALTARLQAAGEILGIQVLDHVIIGDGRHVSFADEGWLTVPASPQAMKAATGRRPR